MLYLNNEVGIRQPLSGTESLIFIYQKEGFLLKD